MFVFCSWRLIFSLSLYSSILNGWRFICIQNQRTTAKDNGQINRITEPDYLSGTKITEVLHLISSNRDIQPLQAYTLVRYNLNDHLLQPYCTTWVTVFSLLSTGHFHRKFTKLSRWAKSRIAYYSNSIATFQFLLRAGDISLNPGPENNHNKTSSRPGPTPKHVAPRCFKCKKPVARNHKRLECGTCDSLTHIRCANTNSICIKNMKANQPGSWTWSNCFLSVLPFQSVKDLNSMDESCDPFCYFNNDTAVQ